MQFNPSRWLTNIKIGPRLLLSYAFIIFLVLVTTGYIAYSMTRAADNARAILEEDVVKLELIQDMNNSVHIVARVMRSVMLLQNDPVESARQRDKIPAAREVYDNAYKHLISMPATEGGLALLQHVDEAKQKARPVNDRIVALYEQGKHDEALSLLLKEERPSVEAWQGALYDYANFQRSKIEESKVETEKAARSVLILTVVMVVALVILAVLAAVFITRSITEPLYNLQGAIHSVRKGADMQALVMVNTRDEFNDMGFAVNQMLQDQISAREKAEADQKAAEENRKKAEAENETLNNSVISILQALDSLSRRDLTVRAPVTRDVIGTVSDSVNALADETSKVLRGVNEIAAEVAEVSARVRSQGEVVSLTAADERQNVNAMVKSLGEAASSINRVAALAEQSNRSAERATEVTDTALVTVNSTVREMDSIRETISETEKRIKRLGERSQEISGIVNLINTLSERTHVLALNASMQAAVAGEAGRGFAVVAEEVQRLAESSRNATQQISTLVNNIQLETNETIATVNRTIGQVVQGSEQAQRAGEQMRQTQAITNELVEQVRRITVASEEQKNVSVLLLESVQRLGRSNEHTADQIETQFLETKVLQESARKLVDSVRVFKLPEHV